MIGPVLAPAGTVALIDESEPTENVVALVPLNVTFVAAVKWLPVIVTTVPTAPLVGLKDEIVGAGGVVTVKLVELDAVPPPVVTAIGPVVAPFGTVALIDESEPTENVVAFVPLNVTFVAP